MPEDAGGELRLPEGLTAKGEGPPTVFIDTRGRSVSEVGHEELGRALGQALERVHPGPVEGPALVKVHVGEPRCSTRMRPELARPCAGFLKGRGASSVSAGDTTVAYTGPRGHRQNPSPRAVRYMSLASRHGWSEDGPAGMPFVVLDRPGTSRDGELEFGVEEERVELSGVRRYGDFYRAGGFQAAGFVVNSAHLTLHGLAGVAGCVKSVAMGLTSLRGKLRMHQSLFPRFNADRCSSCGQCVENCPEGALTMAEGPEPPVVKEKLCIGCGECVAVCQKRAVHLEGSDISDWTRGEETLPVRMVDYTVGLMDGRWDRMVHVLHMCSVTALCDCVNIKQHPLLGRDLGLLIGANPFAVDRLAGRLLAEALEEEDGTERVNPGLLTAAERCASYARDAYGIAAETPVERIDVA